MLEIQDQSAGRFGFSLGFQIATFSMYPHMVFLCAHIPGVSFCVQSSSYKDSSHNRLWPTLKASFQLNHFFKALSSKYSHILRSWGFGLQYLTRILEGQNLAHNNSFSFSSSRLIPICFSETGPSIPTVDFSALSPCSHSTSVWCSLYAAILLLHYHNCLSFQTVFLKSRD